jgi:hypothetical protein
MADLNALIAQGYQFQPMPDPFTQYGKMQQLENSATQNRLAQQQMTENAQLAPLRMREAQAKLNTADLTYEQLKGAQDFVAGVMAKAKESGSNVNDPMDAAKQMLMHPNPTVQGMGKHLAEAYQLIQGIEQQQRFAQGESSPNSFGVPARPAPGATPMPSGASAPVPLAPAASGDAGTPVLTGNALAPPSVNAMQPNRLEQIDKRLAVLRQFSKVPEAVQERAELVKERDRLMTPYTVGNNLVTLGGGVAYTAPEKIVAAATSPEMKNADAFALLKGPVGSLAYNQEYAKQLARLTAKSEGGGGGVAKAPTGYRVTATGDLEPIPGGPAANKPLTEAQAIKRRDTVGKEFKYATSALQTTQDVLDSIAFVKSEPGLARATGFTGTMLPSFPEGAAASADVRLANIKGKVTALGKAAAAASGAIGSIATVEWKILSDQIAAIDPVKGTGPLLAQLDLVEQQAQGAMSRIRDGYERQFGEDFERFPQFSDLPPPKSAVKPKTPEAPNKPTATQGTGGFKYLGKVGGG